MENQLEYYTETGKYRDKFDQALPAMAAYTTFRKEVYKDGALSQKVKRLIASGIRTSGRMHPLHTRADQGRPWCRSYQGRNPGSCGGGCCHGWYSR